MSGKINKIESLENMSSLAKSSAQLSFYSKFVANPIKKQFFKSFVGKKKEHEIRQNFNLLSLYEPGEHLDSIK